MFLVTAAEMAKIEEKTINDLGISQQILMENAGLKIALEIEKLTDKLRDKKITILAGKGNNGGDALVAARHLVNQGADVKVFLVGRKEFAEAGLLNYQIARKLPITFYNIENDNDLNLLRLNLHYTDYLIDGIFGTGLNGKIEGIAKKVIEIANRENCFKIAVDLPSGVNADTGKVLDLCFKADLTITFALPKLGLAIEPGASFAGEIKIVDISIPQQVVKEINPRKMILTQEIINRYLPRRQADSHKGSYGHVLIVGGSLGMMGASYLSGRGAFALGAGMISIAIPKSIQASVAALIPEAMVYPLTEAEEGSLGLVSGPEILKLAKGKAALVIGPGMGGMLETTALVQWLLRQDELKNIPVIIDADGLRCLAQDLAVLENTASPIIITPHPGEMARILKLSTGEVQNKRIELSTNLAQKWGIWVVLKGKNTIIATPEGQVLVNPTGSAALATAGSGDILAGMIGAMLGQSQNITPAIATAVYIHGLAGEWAGCQVGEISSKALDIVESIPVVIKKEFSHDGK